MAFGSLETTVGGLFRVFFVVNPFFDLPIGGANL